jgi:DNA-binding XRE family transcriptional regulator
MSQTKTKYRNSVMKYRERFRFTQEQLAYIVGCKSERSIRRIESGEVMPGALLILRLGAALRVPVDALYEETYILLREQVRAAEERMPKGTQGVLPIRV